MATKRRIVLAIVLLGLIGGGGYLAMSQGLLGGPDLQRPSFGVADYGDWGGGLQR